MLEHVLVTAGPTSTPAAIFTTMQLRLFSGTAPATADALETGTLLLVLTGDFVDATTYNALTWLDTAAALGVLLLAVLGSLARDLGEDGQVERRVEVALDRSDVLPEGAGLAPRQPAAT